MTALLLPSSPLSSIDTVYLSFDATASGEWVLVRWLDWARRLEKVKATTFAADGTPSETLQSGSAGKGFITLLIESCPPALYAALRTLQRSASKYTFTAHHPQLGALEYRVSVKSVSAPDDEQLEEGDPIENVTVILTVFAKL